MKTITGIRLQNSHRRYYANFQHQESHSYVEKTELMKLDAEHEFITIENADKTS